MPDDSRPQSPLDSHPVHHPGHVASPAHQQPILKRDIEQEYQAATAQPLDTFARNLLFEKGITAEAEPEVFDGMKADLVERLERLTTQTMLMGLSEDDLVEFESMVDKGADQESLTQFAESKVPNLQDKLMESYLNFRNIYLKPISTT